MKELEIAISLALAGLRITPEQQVAISEAKFVDLVDMGLSLEEIATLKNMTAKEMQRSIAQFTTYGDKSEMLSECADGSMDAGRDFDYGHGEAKMTKRQLYGIVKNASALHDMLMDGDDLPEWVQSKISQAEMAVDDVAEYLEYKMLSGMMHES
jgi:membrane-associated PAP2 superfamily phosphatase